MSALANSKDSDEMSHNATFHQCLQYLLRQNLSSEEEIQFYLEIVNCETVTWIMQWPISSLLYQTWRKNSWIHHCKYSRAPTGIQKHNSMIFPWFSMINDVISMTIECMASNLSFKQHLHHAEHKCGMQHQQHACRPCMPFKIIKTWNHQ